ncbi:hypothetical protein F2P81_025109 [Scophthalmus maximus]|uniref:Uncharacterized protein n=1 Tax=Scophthalmus maximus TaxID=52904 RepID=A0A6A4RQY5_SCOMX|nr:hypothetical protein F2P81_025109 [Scophthalmus maximus]
MDPRTNELQGSRHSERSSSSPLAWPCHTKCYSSHIEEYNENITLGSQQFKVRRFPRIDYNGKERSICPSIQYERTDDSRAYEIPMTHCTFLSITKRYSLHVIFK